MILNDSFIEFILASLRLLIWWAMSFGLIYIGSKLYFVDKLNFKTQLTLIVVVILISQFASKLIVSGL